MDFRLSTIPWIGRELFALHFLLSLLLSASSRSAPNWTIDLSRSRRYFRNYQTMRRFSTFFLFLPICLFYLKSLAQDKELKVLFVGNSLTYVNDLPKLIKEIALLDHKALAYKSFSKPDYSLEDHWNEGMVQRELRKKNGYDFVVLQQGPSAMPASQILLTEYASKFAELSRRCDATPALYMVWPSAQRSFDHAGVILSYSNAAEKTGSLLCPAGAAWKHAWEADPALALYGPDRFHPSKTGSVLAALAIYGALTGKRDFDFIDQSKCSWKNEIPKQQFQVLKEAATKALNGM